MIGFKLEILNKVNKKEKKTITNIDRVLNTLYPL